MSAKRNKSRGAQTATTAAKRAEPARVLSIAKSPNNENIANIAAWCFAALILLGYIAFRVEGTLARGNKMSPDRALFAVVNAATLTGFQLNLDIDHYNWPGQWAMLVLTVGGTMFALIVGGIAVARIARLPYRDKEILIGAAAAQLAVLVIGAISAIRSDDAFVARLLQTCSAFGNSGLWMGAAPDLFSWRTHLLFLPLVVLGGLGLPVLMDLVDAARGKRAMSNHTLTVLKLSALVYLLGLFVCFILRWPADLKTAHTVLVSSSTASINARSAGLPIEFAADFPRYVQWILIALMAIGPAPGGTGGGLKVTTIQRLVNGVREILTGRNPGHIFGIAVVWLAAFVSLVFVALLLLFWTEPGLDADRLLFIATSAAANVGLAHDRVGIVGIGAYVLTLTMLLGRILPIAILWWTLKYAEESDVAIG